MLVPSLDVLQKISFPIVSIVDEYTKALTAFSVLTVSAMLLYVDEGEIFDPSQLSASKATEIKRIRMSEDIVLSSI